MDWGSFLIGYVAGSVCVTLVFWSLYNWNN